MLSLHQATVATITAEIAYLQWQLDQTKLLAPTDGTITQLTLRVGDQAVVNAPLIGLVDAHAWRIYANYKESVIRHMEVGRTAWVWLDTYPWHVHRARIQGIARGISREQGERKLLPYVAPTTDWIRLERRFPAYGRRRTHHPLLLKPNHVARDRRGAGHRIELTRVSRSARHDGIFGGAIGGFGRPRRARVAFRRTLVGGHFRLDGDAILVGGGAVAGGDAHRRQRSGRINCCGCPRVVRL